MAQKANSKEADFSPGSIMLQYVDDDTRFVGMVAGKHMVSALNERDLRWFNVHNDDRYAIYLILGWFQGCEARWSIFSGDREIRFPSYTIGEKRVATPTELKEELELLRRHNTEPTSRGLNMGRLRNIMFGFSGKQLEVLNLVALTQHYMAGGDVSNIPKWADSFLVSKQRFFNELKIAIHAT